MVDTTGFVTSLVINAAIAIIALTAFVLLRPRYAWCYETRRDPKRRRTGHEPPTLPPGMWSWLPYLLRLSDAEVMETAGLDALMLIKFFSLCCQLFCAFTVLGIGVLLPVNWTASGGITDDFDRMSMANVPNGSRRFWAHLLIGYMFCLVFYYLVYHLWRDYLNLRHQFLSTWTQLGGHRTLLINNLPKHLRSDRALFAFFDELFPGQVRSARTAKDLYMAKSERNKLDSLDKNVAARVGVQAELEGNIVQWEKSLRDPMLQERERKRPQKALTAFCCNKVDAIDHNAAELERLNDLIEGKKRAMAAHDAGDVENDLSGFVTFRSAQTAAAARNFVYDTAPYSFHIKRAPECRDVYWPNLAISHYERTFRSTVFNIITALLVLFWMIPMGFLQGLANLQGLAEKYDWLSGVDNIPTVILGFIEAYVPSLLVSIFLALVPLILLEFTKAQGVEARSWQQRSVLDKYFLFIVLNFFFGSIVGSSIFANITALFNDVANVPTVLGQTIPNVSNYFLNYVALAAFAGFPISLSQAPRLIVAGLKKRFLCVTPRQFEAAEAPPETNYAVEYCRNLFIFLIGLTYSYIAPLILPFTAVYFFLGFVLHKYQLVFVSVQSFETGGTFWPKVYRKIIACALIAQLCLVGILGIKEVAAPAVLVIPMPILTLLFDYYIRTAIKRKCDELPIGQLCELDQRRAQAMRQQEQDKQSAPRGSEKAAPALAMDEDKVVDDAASPRQLQLDSGNDAARDPESLQVPPQSSVFRTEPVAERRNNGDDNTTRSYMADALLDEQGHVCSEWANAAVGFPYAPTEQRRAIVEGDVHDYLPPELTPIVPPRIEVARTEQHLTSGNARIKVSSSLPHTSSSSSSGGGSNGADAAAAGAGFGAKPALADPYAKDGQIALDSVARSDDKV